MSAPSRTPRCHPPRRPALPVRLAAVVLIALVTLALAGTPVLGSAPPVGKVAPAATSYTIQKTVVGSAFVRPTDQVSFDIKITNTGDTYLTKLPLREVYDPEYLSFAKCGTSGAATYTPDDFADDGQLDWSDLTTAAPYGIGQPLAPDMSLTLTVTFSALRDTFFLPNGATTNTARVHDGLADPDENEPLPPEPLPQQESSATLQIASPTCGSSSAAADGRALRSALRPACTASVSGVVWKDLDFDGSPVYPDPGINGVSLTLYTDDGDGKFEPGGDDSLVSTGTSGANPYAAAGSYSLLGPPAPFCRPDSPVWVNVDAANFGTGAALYHMVLTSAAVYGPAPTFRLLPKYGGISDANFGYNEVGSYSIAVVQQVPPIAIHETFSVTFRITNTGNHPIAPLPFTATYNPTYLTYNHAIPASDDNVDDGTINWHDLLAVSGLSVAGEPIGGDLMPGQKLSITLYFTGRADTSGLPGSATNITTKSEGAMADPDGPGGLNPLGPLPVSETSAPVTVYIKTGVTLADFKVEQGTGGVKLSWETASEADILGFNVLRRSGSGYEAVNPELILAAHVGLDRGDAYAYVDAGARPNRAAYALEIVHLDGGTEIVGAR